MLGKGAVSWDLSKERTLALSNTEAEYMSLSEATKEAISYIYWALIALLIRCYAFHILYCLT